MSPAQPDSAAAFPRSVTPQLVVLKVVVAAAFAAVAGRLPDHDLAWHRALLIAFALAQAISAWISWRRLSVCR